MKTDEYYMGLAEEIAKLSTDISTKVGCVIVNSKGDVVAKGYNGFPKECDKKYMSNELPYRHLLSVHAELRALLTSKYVDFKDCIAYVTHASCENCLKHLIVVGVKEVIYKNFSTNGKFINKERGEAIEMLIKGSNIINRNINGKNFLEEIKENDLL